VQPDLVVSVVLGLGFCRWSAVQTVHKPGGVVPVHPRGGDVFEVGQRAQRPVRNGESSRTHSVLYRPIEGISPANISVSVKCGAVYPASL
jgi:hypothetical protein